MGEDFSRIVRCTADGSVEAATGDVLFFSTERFVRDICIGDACFLCGALPGSRPFNNEHVLPRWLLRRHALFSRLITLPNGTAFRYGQYKIPCCTECNSLAGRMIEEPIREMFSGGHEAISEHLTSRGPLLLFVWLSLVFLKTHLKDKHLRLQQDSRLGTEPISDFYDWKDLHHVHCIARSFVTRCALDAEAFGSILVLPAKQASHYEAFDFHDIYQAQSILIRAGDAAIICVLNDSCGSFSAFRSTFDKIGGPCSPIQLRELLAHLSYINLHLVRRPVFRTDFSDGLRIRGAAPEKAELDDFDQQHLGELLTACCGNMLEHFENPNIEEVRANLQDGKHTFLWDSQGDFDSTSMDPIIDTHPA